MHILFALVIVVLLTIFSPFLLIGVLPLLIFMFGIPILLNQCRGISTNIEKIKKQNEARRAAKQAAATAQMAKDRRQKARDRKHSQSVQRPGAEGYYNKANRGNQ